MNCPKCGKEIPAQRVQCSCGFYVGNQSLYIEYKTTVQPKAKEEPVLYAAPVVEEAVKAEKVKKPAKKSNGVSVAALILAFLIPPLGLILGIIGLILGCKRAGVGRGRSIAALVISTMLIGSFFGGLYFLKVNQYSVVKDWLRELIDIFF